MAGAVPAAPPDKFSEDRLLLVGRNAQYFGHMLHSPASFARHVKQLISGVFKGFLSSVSSLEGECMPHGLRSRD